MGRWRARQQAEPGRGGLDIKVRIQFIYRPLNGPKNKTGKNPMIVQGMNC